MGGAGDPPAPVGDPPTGTAVSNVAKRLCLLAGTVAPRPASRRTAQAGRLCYQQTIFQTRSNAVHSRVANEQAAREMQALQLMCESQI